MKFLISILLLTSFTSCGQEKNKTDTTHKFTNHLIHESSPYLLQHAHNPVNWYPWGEEALEKAKMHSIRKTYLKK